MRAEWKEMSVADLRAAGALLVEDGNHGENRPRPDEFSTDGTLFIRAADMDGGRVLFERAQRINEVARHRVRKGIGAGGDVLLSHKGTVGKVAYVPLDAPPFVCSPQTTFWRVTDPEQLDRRYIYFYLLSRAFREQLDSRKGETDMADYVSLTTQRTLKVIVPQLAEQKAISAVLGALDDKIELNRRMNATLKAMARALFKSWFVDFDPVRSKLSAHSHTSLNSEITALFPESLGNSPLGYIPKGWEVGTIEDATSLIIDYRGKTPKKLRSDWSESGIPAVSAKNVKGGSLVRPEMFNFVSEELYERWMKEKLALGDILMTSEAPLGELYYLALDARFCLSQRIFAMRANPARCESTFLYFWLESPACQTEIINRGTGTTVEGIRQTELRKVSVLLPPLSIQKIAAKFLAAWTEQIHRNEKQSCTLTALRDALLPRLLSGELRVGEGEKIAETVVHS